MPLTFTLDPDPTPGLLAEVVALWTGVSNAGGAVGFVPPVTEDRVRVTAEKQFAGVGPGRPDRLLIARETATGRLAGLLFFESQRFDLQEHWRMLKRVMVHPSMQGTGYGARLLAEAERIARGWGLDSLRLTVRGGTGLERFYKAGGYVEVGRVPRSIRVAPGDDRDEITMWLDLTV
ncbi:GNAT family N-acetyltransferase [Kitasatospora camelliae]|uniref:GNAT family N-acetyltransferase n=1 Tax=Kitasatospora camelliae TaxID=3156397 RepID=A0AAU8JX78_9ACTN